MLDLDICLEMPPNKIAVQSQDTAAATGIQISLKQFLFCLKVTSLQYVRDQSELFTKNKRMPPFYIYSVVVVVLLVTNFLFSLSFLSTVTEFSAQLCNNIISSVWFLQVACFSINNVVCNKKWANLYQAWDKYAEKHKFNTLLAMRKYSLGLTVGYITWLVCSFVFLGLSTLGSGGGGFPIPLPSEVIIVIQIYLYIAYFYFVSTWFLLTAQFMLLCLLFYHSLRSHCRQSIEALDAGTFLDDVENHRLHHDELCNLLQKADGIVSFFVLVTMFTTIPLIVLTLYFVLFQEGADTFSYAATWWSVSLSTIQLFLVFVGGGFVNSAAHQLLPSVYSVDLRKTSADKMHQMTVFLGRLSSHPIGFSACGLFVIDKPTIMTFVGSILTYAIVIIQFRPSTEEAASTTCNCTDNSG